MGTKSYYLKLFSIILAFTLLSNILFGQVYSGKNLTKPANYNCLLRINADDTVNFIYNRHNNTSYGEYYGWIKKLNDTLFHISATMALGKFMAEAYDTDSIYVLYDNTVIRQIGKIRITYSNGSFKEYSNYDKNETGDSYLKIKANKNLFNKSKGKGYITISIDRKNPITQKPLVFNVPFGSAASFANNEKIEIDIVIKNGYLWSVGSRLWPIDYFKLKEVK